MVDQLARELVGGLLTQTPADVVSTVAAPMPMRAITSVLGVDGPDEAAFCRLSNQAVRITDVALSASGLISLVQGFAGFRRLRALFTHRRDNGLLRSALFSGSLPPMPSKVDSAMTNCSSSRCCCWLRAMRALLI